MKKNLLIVFVLLFSFSTFSQVAPVTVAPRAKSSPGQTITIPVKVASFNDIGALSLTLNFNYALIHITGITPNSSFNDFAADWTTNQGVLRVAWYGVPGVSLADSSELFNITFSIVGTGISELEWIDDGPSCEFASWDNGNISILSDTPYSDHYKNGQIEILRGAPVTICPFMTASPGQTITVPVTVRSFENIGAISLTLDYISSVLTFQSISFVSIPGSWTIEGNGSFPGRILIAGFGRAISALPDNTILFNIIFTYNGGVSPLSWYDSDETSCEYVDGTSVEPLYDDPASFFYIDGQISQSPMVVDFIADNTAPLRNTTVCFTDHTLPAPTSCSWSFDRSTVIFVSGTCCTTQNPQVQFTEGGPYTVTLTVFDASGTAMATKVAYIRAGTPGLWTGTASTVWNTGTNWENWLVPDPLVDVLIPSSAPNWPVFNGNLNIGTHCKSLKLEGPGSILTITGDLINL